MRCLNFRCQSVQKYLPGSKCIMYNPAEDLPARTKLSNMQFGEFSLKRDFIDIATVPKVDSLIYFHPYLRNNLACKFDSLQFVHINIFIGNATKKYVQDGIISLILIYIKC